MIKIEVMAANVTDMVRVLHNELGREMIEKLVAYEAPPKVDPVAAEAYAAERAGQTKSVDVIRGATPEVNAAAEIPGVKSRTRRTKEQIAADAARDAEAQRLPAPTQAAVVENTASTPAALVLSAAEGALPASAATVAPPSLTSEAVREKLMAVNKAKGMEAVKTILAAHGLTKVSAITDDKFAAVYASAEKALA